MEITLVIQKTINKYNTRRIKTEELYGKLIHRQDESTNGLCALADVKARMDEIQGFYSDLSSLTAKPIHLEIKKSSFPSLFVKIPILISKWSDGNIKGWRAEVADNYENYKTARYADINFDDLGFHFKHNTLTHEKDELVFYRRKDAVECANYVNKQYLGGKAKIWFL